MSEAHSNTLVSEAELQAAQATVDSQTAEAAAIPSLEENPTESADPKVLVPVPTVQAPVTRAAAPADSTLSHAASPKPAANDNAPQTPPATNGEPNPSAAASRPQLKVGRKAKSETPGTPAAVATEAKTATAPQAAPPSAGAPRESQRLYRFFDMLLMVVNWPFAWIPMRVRNAVGPVALATLAISALAGLLLPKLFPHQNALTFLAEKRTEQRRPKTEPQAKDAAKDDGHAAEKKADAGGGHGGH